MRTRLLLLSVLACSVAGCGGKQVDTPKGEAFIAKELRRSLGTEPSSVACPKDIAAEKGASFDCKVTGADGTSGIVKVTQKDGDGNVAISAPFLPTNAYERQLGKEISGQLSADVTLDCPEIVVARKSDTFECDATSSTGKVAVKVTQKDARGNVTYRLKRR